MNDVLCYISSARNSLTQEVLITNCVGFYSGEKIKEAKRLICGIADERPINRRNSSNVRDPIAVEAKDICEAFEKIENNEISAPVFVAKGHNSFPPNGFEYLAPVMCSLRDELAAMRLELAQLKQNGDRDVRALNSLEVVSQDISEIKTIVQRSYSGGLPGTKATVNETSRNANSMRHDAAETWHDAAETVNNASNAASLSSRNENNATGNNETVNNASNAASSFLSNENNTTGNNDFTLVQNRRPYSNAHRKNGLPSNPSRRQSASTTTGNTITRDSVQGGRDAGRDPQRNGGNRRNVISGTRTSASNFAGGLRVFDVYVGGCKPDCTSEALIDYCSQNGVTVKNCEALPVTSRWVSSFKVAVTEDDREKLLKGEFWPCGVIVRKFFKGKSKQQS